MPSLVSFDFAPTQVNQFQIVFQVERQTVADTSLDVTGDQRDDPFEPGSFASHQAALDAVGKERVVDGDALTKAQRIDTS